MLTTAAVLDALDQPFRIEEVEIDEPRPGEVLVQVVATGVCHTDSLAKHGAFPFVFPGVLGHEGAGIVAAVGEGVTAVAEGDVGEAIHDICGGKAELALECTGDLGVVRQAIDSLGPRGTCALIGAAPFGSEFQVDHGSTLWGKRIVGVLGGEGTSATLIGALIDLHLQGRFPFDRLIEPFPLDQINEAVAASHAGDVLKPVLRMPG